MGRPFGTKNIMRSAEEKEKMILKYLNSKQTMTAIANEYDVTLRLFRKWVRKYEAEGFKGLKSKTGQNYPTNFGKHNRNPSEIEKLKQELLKKEIEIERLKKGYQVKGVGVKKEYVTTFDTNMK